MSSAIVGGAVVAALAANVVIGTVTSRVAALAQTDPKRSLGAALRPAVFFAILLMGCYEAAQVWPFRPQVQQNVDKGALALAAVIGIFAALRVSNRAFRWWLMHKSADHERTVLTGALRGVNAAIWVVGLLVILDVLGYQIGPLLASLGIAGIALAVGLQDTVAGLLGGLFIILDRPMVIGDLIRLESGVEGHVEHIGWRSTRLVTADGDKVIVPNVTLAKSVVTTHSQSLSVVVKVDQNTVLLALERACAAATADIGATDPRLMVLGFPAGAMEFSLRARSDPERSLPETQSDLRKAIYVRLQEAGIKLA